MSELHFNFIKYKILYILFDLHVYIIQ